MAGFPLPLPGRFVYRVLTVLACFIVGGSLAHVNVVGRTVNSHASIDGTEYWVLCGWPVIFGHRWVTVPWSASEPSVVEPVKRFRASGAVVNATVAAFLVAATWYSCNRLWLTVQRRTFALGGIFICCALCAAMCGFVQCDTYRHYPLLTCIESQEEPGITIAYMPITAAPASVYIPVLGGIAAGVHTAIAVLVLAGRRITGRLRPLASQEAGGRA